MPHVLATEEGGPVIGGFEIAETVVFWIEVVAITVIAAAVLVAIVIGAARGFSSRWADALERFRTIIADGLLAGLDLLIAADIIKTVTLAPTIENVGILAILVLIRTFLSWTLVLEVEERWPWQKGPR